MNISFENKVALVTGAGSGMGLTTARAFAAAGAAVALADVNEKAVRSAAEELVAVIQDVHYVFGDFSSEPGLLLLRFSGPEFYDDMWHTLAFTFGIVGR